MNMTKVRSKSGQGIQLMLLGGTVYLRDGEETFLTEVHMTHNTVQTAIRNGDLIVIDEVPSALPAIQVEKVEDDEAAPIAEIEAEEAKPHARRQRQSKGAE